MDLTTAARVSTAVLGTATGPAPFLLQVGQLITQVSAAVEAYLDRYATSGVSRTEYLTASKGQRVFRLRAFPVASVTSVSFDTEAAFGAETVVDTTDYYSPVQSEAGLLRFKYAPLIGDGLGDDVPCLKVVYTGGMAANAGAFVTAYPDIAGAVDQQVAYFYHTRNELGRASVSGDSGSSSPGADSWLPSVVAVLDKYRRLL